MSKKYLVKQKKCQKHQNWITHYWIFSIFFVDIFTQHGTAANILPDENGTSNNSTVGSENWWDGLQNHLVDLQNQLNSQQKEFEGLQNQVEGLQNQLEGLQRNPVPIGFVYVQLSAQPEPRSIWPQTGWADISSLYAGLFFRVLGGGSAKFGETQNENSPRIREIRNRPGDGNHLIDVPADGEWTLPLWTGSDLGCVTPSNPCHWSMYFRQSAGEVRPRNQAVRIWRRIR